VNVLNAIPPWTWFLISAIVLWWFRTNTLNLAKNAGSDV
jgi:hypothetical protein